jgi:hypothetical protein
MAQERDKAQQNGGLKRSRYTTCSVLFCRLATLDVGGGVHIQPRYRQWPHTKPFLRCVDCRSATPRNIVEAIGGLCHYDL